MSPKWDREGPPYDGVWRQQPTVIAWFCDSLDGHLFNPRSTQHDIKVLFLIDHCLMLGCPRSDGYGNWTERLDTGVSSRTHGVLLSSQWAVFCGREETAARTLSLTSPYLIANALDT